jgi:hypothetical protein
MFTIWLADAYRVAGDLDRAHERAGAGLNLATSAAFPFGIALARRAFGRIERSRGRPAEAATGLHAALDGFLAIEAAFEAARTRCDLADAARAAGDAPAAVAHLASARRTFEALGLAAFAEEIERRSARA